MLAPLRLATLLAVSTPCSGSPEISSPLSTLLPVNAL